MDTDTIAAIVILAPALVGFWGTVAVLIVAATGAPGTACVLAVVVAGAVLGLAGLLRVCQQAARWNTPIAVAR